MAYLKINNEKITAEIAEKLKQVCPFSAILYENGILKMGAGCKMCKLCVKKGEGAIEMVADRRQPVDKDDWKGICVYVEHNRGEIHNVTLELIGKALELAKVTGHPVYALMIGCGIKEPAQKLLKYGVNKVFIYDDTKLESFKIEPYASAFEDMINKVKPSSVLVGATNLGRSLAPRVAARFHTGLTADCTVLEMKENTDLVQIRPAFGGNIMAQIVTPYNRPQFCTVRYKIFSAPMQSEHSSGEVTEMKIGRDKLDSAIEILENVEKAKEIDISEAEIIIAAGRGIKTKEGLDLIYRLADVLDAQVACTRPLIECGWFDSRHQIGLSGRTVKAKLIIAAGISGSVQFAVGMRNSEYIVAINSDPNASVFDIAHCGLVGDLYKILPRLIARIKGEVTDGIR